MAIKKLAPDVDVMLVIGAQNSSNSKRLVEVAKNAGVEAAYLIADSTALDFDLLKGAQTIGLSAGASAPEVLVDEVIAALQAAFDLTISHHNAVMEDMHFKLPPILNKPDMRG